MKVELRSVYGDDCAVVNSARVSYGKEVSSLSEKDIKLLKFLASSNPPHWAPFAHPQLTFRITCSIVVERQLFKHKIGVVDSSISGRYLDFSDIQYDLPEKFRFQSPNSKQGSAGDIPDEMTNHFKKRIEEVISLSREVYKEMADYNVAKEQCRYACLLGMETTFIRTMSLYAFIGMCRHRIEATAQKETHDLVQKMLELVREDGRFQYSLEAFGL